MPVSPEHSGAYKLPISPRIIFKHHSPHHFQHSYCNNPPSIASRLQAGSGAEGKTELPIREEIKSQYTLNIPEMKGKETTNIKT
jgi:hypothetical protein